ncbi:MAG: hypothetical protein AAFY45_30625 [Bacteroidota bacterium]
MGIVIEVDIGSVAGINMVAGTRTGSGIAKITGLIIMIINGVAKVKEAEQKGLTY